MEDSAFRRLFDILDVLLLRKGPSFADACCTHSAPRNSVMYVFLFGMPPNRKYNNNADNKSGQGQRARGSQGEMI